jgi:hypothetical protein
MSTNINSTKPKNIARNVSFGIGGVALVLIIASIVLLITYRNKKTIVRYIAPAMPIVVPPSQIGNLTLKPFVNSQALDTFQFNDFDHSDTFNDKKKHDLPLLVNIGENYNGCSLKNKDDKSFVYPGEIIFSSTVNDQLRQYPEGYGWLSILPDGSQWFTSFANGYASFGQYIKLTNKYGAYKDAYKNKTQNRILYNCKQSNKDQSNVNIFASAVGCLGPRAIAVSEDGLRLYVGYRMPTGDNVEVQQPFPFGQMVGGVAVYTRALDLIGKVSTSKDWTFSCSLQLINPFGSQIRNVVPAYDVFNQKTITNDEFGSIIRVSHNSTSKQRMVGVRSYHGFDPDDGAIIVIYEENITFQHNLSGIVSLPNTDVFKIDDKTSFGIEFDICDDVLLASIPLKNQVAVFNRNEEGDWNFNNVITSPNENQEFGRSICMSTAGYTSAKLALIGSPTKNLGVGGSVYLYEENKDDKTWKLVDTLNDPDPTLNTKGSFGYFIRTDIDSLVASISSNQYKSTLQDGKLKAIDSNINDINQLPHVTIVSINYQDKKINSDQRQRIPQQANIGQYIDATFGASVALAFTDQSTNQLNILTSSVVNQIVELRIMNL